MTTAVDKRLYDVLTRKQLYTERVKVQYAKDFAIVLAALAEELRRIISRVSYTKLDMMTKVELGRLILSVRESQQKTYSAYSEKLLNQLQEFMQADLEVTRRSIAPVIFAMASGQDEPEMTDAEATAFIKDHSDSTQFSPIYPIGALTGDNDRLWSSVKAAPMPANGLYLLPFIKNFTSSASASVENLIRKGYANGSTPNETVNEIVGTGNKQGFTGQLQRVAVQAAAVSATAIQHITGMVSAGVASSLMSSYLWVSVIDSGTSEICMDRNNQVFEYGNGPLPPAHIRCRSHTSPLTGSEGFDGPNFVDWTAEQPHEFLEDFFDEDTNDIINGIVSNSALTANITDSALTLSQYRNKVDLILSR